jgi:hypothetical protein
MLSDMRAMKVLVVSLFTAIGWLGVHSPAAAQAAETVEISPTRIYGGLWLGFAGQAGVDHNTENGSSTTVGGQFGLDVIGLREAFSLGIETRIGSAKWTMGESTKLLDFVLKPRLRIHPEGVPLEFYVTVPVGLTVPRFSDVGKAHSDADVGWNLGAGGGVNLFFSEDFGINVEPMWLQHSFKGDGHGGGDFTIKQFSLFLNAVIAL